MTLEEKIETFRHTACEICPAKKVCTKQEDIETCEIYKKAKESTSYAIVYNAGLKDAELSKKYWHEVAREGLPVVEGWYLCLSQGRMLISYDCAFFNGSKFEWSDTDLSQFVIAWHKIKEYK